MVLCEDEYLRMEPNIRETYYPKIPLNLSTSTRLDGVSLDTSGLGEVIEKVWGRLRNALASIIEGKGGNDLFESKRGETKIDCWRIQMMTLQQHLMNLYTSIQL